MHACTSQPTPVQLCTRLHTPMLCMGSCKQQEHLQTVRVPQPKKQLMQSVATQCPGQQLAERRPPCSSHPARPQPSTRCPHNAHTTATGEILYTHMRANTRELCGTHTWLEGLPYQLSKPLMCNHTHTHTTATCYVCPATPPWRHKGGCRKLACQLHAAAMPSKQQHDTLTYSTPPRGVVVGSLLPPTSNCWGGKEQLWSATQQTQSS